MAASLPQFGQFFGLDVPEGRLGRLRLTFVYVTSLSDPRHVDWILESTIIERRPYAIVFNTGAWDFDASTLPSLTCCILIRIP
jgi:hypothetical protein